MRAARTWPFLLTSALLLSAAALPLAADRGGDDERTLYGMAHLGPTSPNLLYAIDPETGAATQVGSTGTSILRISALALSGDGVLYAVGWRPGPSGETHVLVTIDLESGAATEVGPTGLESFVGVFPQRRVMSDMTFSECGELFAYTFPGGGLATIDLETGAATQRIPPGFPGTGFHNGGGLAFSRDEVLYHGGDGGNQPGQGAAGLQALDPQDSTVLFELPLLFPPGFGLDPRPNGMDFEPRTGVLHSLLKANLMEQAAYFGTIDPVTGVVTVLGQTADGLSALAWGPDEDGRGRGRGRGHGHGHGHGRGHGHGHGRPGHCR
jgi:hypothetical protein